MDVIRHGNEFVQFDVIEPLGQPPPDVLDGLPQQRLFEERLAVMRTYRDEEYAGGIPVTS